MILGYPLITVPKTLREWKMVITSVGQGYKSMESWQDYRTGTRTTYGGRDTLINIGKVKDNFNKDKKPKCFNCNTYRCMTKKCQRSKKE